MRLLARLSRAGRGRSPERTPEPAPGAARRPAGEAAARLGSRTALALGLLAVVPYLDALRADFTFDDKVIVRDNPRLASPDRVGEIFATHYFGGPLATAKNYRPVVLLTYALQRWTTGNRPWPFHAVNVALHAAVTLLLAAWLLALGMPRAPSLATAALFAVAPIHVEAVTGVVGRAELLVALLVLAGALLFLRATDGPRLLGARYAGALAAFLVALFTKENAVVLPGVVVLGELLRRGAPGPLAERLRRKAPAVAGLLLPLGAFVLVRATLVGSSLLTPRSAFFELDNPLAPLPGLLRAANGLVLLLRYTAQTFVPLGYSADHSAHALDLVASLADPRAAAGLAGVLALAAAAVAGLRRVPLVPLGAGLFLGAFLPTSNVLFPIGTIYADRLAYLPSAGLLAAAAGAVAALPSASRGFRSALLAVALATYAGATVARNEVFRDDDRLFAEMVARFPRSARARYNVATLSWARGETIAARASLEKAVSLFPRYYDAWALLGLVHAKEGRTEAARAALRESVRIKPDYEYGWAGLARVAQESGRLAEAARAVDEGLRRAPRSRALLVRRAKVLEAQGRTAEALGAWDAAVEATGGGTEERLGRARALAALGREAASLAEARRAVAAAPRSVEARLFLAVRIEARGNPVAAAAELARAARAAPRDPVPARLLLELAAREPRARPIAASALPAIERALGRPVRNLALRAAVEAFRAGDPSGRRADR